MAGYRYDSWGKLLSCTGELADSIGAVNPLRYRGYYYDSESGLYYLNSRYYDPETGRFLNADDPEILLEDQGHLLQYNQYIYCANNAVNCIDAEGTFFGSIISQVVSHIVMAVSVANSILLVGIAATIAITTICIVRSAKSKSSQETVIPSKDNIAVSPKATEKSKPRTITLIDVKGKRTKEKVYFFAHVEDGILHISSYAMGYTEALGCVKVYKGMNHKFTKWGIYTSQQVHTKNLGLSTGAYKGPEVYLGGYPHYYDPRHIFHIWYGGIMEW